jgi:ribosomal 50S subunit-recycling heat shock protein
MAKEVADQGRITINGNKAKASSTVEAGDELIIKFGQNTVTLEIANLRENVKKDEAQTLYKIIKEEKND